MNTTERVCKTLLAVAAIFVCGLLSGPFSETASAQANADAVSTTVGQNRVAPRITQAIDESKLFTLRGNVHPLARPEFDRGPVSDAQPMQRMLLLLQRSPEQESALRQLLDDQQTKDSPNFHKWLTPQQFGQQFGPADADIQTVVNWLQAQGFTGIKVGAGRVAIEFSGNVGMVRNAFHTEINKFVVNGKDRQANVSDPQIPAALSPVVAGIVKLNDFPRRSMSRQLGTFVQMKDGRILPQFTGNDTSGQFFAVGPADFAKIYGITGSGFDGTGAKIAVIGTSDVDLNDVANFRALFGLAAKPPNKVLNGPNPQIQVKGEEGEADLDVEWSGAVAPAATIDFVISEDTLTASGIDLGAFYVVENNTDDIMSLSFGACEAALGSTGTSFYHDLWEQAAAQGISVTVSAGDNGSAGCDDFNAATTASNGLGVNGIASTPFNVAVGGTDFDDAGVQTTGGFWSTGNDAATQLSAQGYIHERPWNESCAAAAISTNLNTICAHPDGIVAGSGGPSSIPGSKPSWQTALTPADGVRDLPDVSLFSSLNSQSKSFYVVCEADLSASCVPAGGQFSFLAVGGTSASSPAFAAILALIGQSESQAGRSRRLGNPNYTLYKIAGMTGQMCDSSHEPLTGSTCAFHDVTTGTNAVPCSGGASKNCSAAANGVLVDPAHNTTPAWTAVAGYDFATGLGTVNVTNLVVKWAAVTALLKATNTTLAAVGSTTIAHGHSLNFTATVISAGAGSPTGDVSVLGPSGALNSGNFRGTLAAAGANTATAAIVTGPTTSLLPGGSYSVMAHYPGDSTFAPSDSNPIAVNVTPEASHLLAGIITFDFNTGNILSTNGTTFAYGSPYIFRADVLNSGGTANNCQPLVQNGQSTGCAFDATGTVTLTDNGAPLDGGSFKLNSQGHTEDQPIQLSTGQHAVVATYGGDNSYSAATPVNLQLTVTKATTSVTVSAIPSPIVSGASVTLTAIVNTQSSGVAPGGTVQFLSGSTPISGTVTLTPTDGGAAGPASLKATITTTLSALNLPQTPAPKWPGLPLAPLALAATAAALLAYLAAKRSRKQLAYASAAFALLLSAAIAMSGCGGGSSTAQGKSISISAQYSGDANYNASTGQTAIPVQ